MDHLDSVKLQVCFNSRQTRLEVIEAKFLFGLVPEQIEVVIHPQSIIHSMVQYRDSSVLAQLGTPDMRVPIAYGLAWPERIHSGANTLNFASLSDMTFEAPDMQRFPALPLAWDVRGAPVGSTAVLNAANEVAVAAFLNHQISFTQIHQVNEATLAAVSVGVDSAHSLGDVLALDAEARQVATGLAATLQA